MLTDLQLDDQALWKQRFRAPIILWTQLAKAAPDRGLAVSNTSGKYQLYAWEVPTGVLRQLTDRPTGIFFGWLAPDGRYVYYLDDQQGNEIGHYVRIPFEGGEPQDLTPDLPLYSSFFFDGSRLGNRIGFTLANAEGFHTYSMNSGPGEALGVPQRLFHSDKWVIGPVFSHDGEFAVIATTDRTHTLTRLSHPGGTFVFFAGMGTYFGPGDEIFAQWQDSTHPSQLIALNSTTGVKTRTVLAAGEVPPSRPWKSVTFTSSDGQIIQGWLGLPEGEGPFPTIFDTHGGPEAVMTEVFGPISQSWMDHGFAFLTINYRGSTTFGREFQEKIWGNPGHWEIEDMAAAREWLVREGIAHPNQILLTGWSYGGYNTLMALGKRPDLWAGGWPGSPLRIGP